MVVGVVVCELHIPGARSLKEKRKVVKGLVERAHRRFRVSVGETDFHDLHQRAEISMAAVGRRESEVEKILASLRRLFEGQGEAFVSSWEESLLHEESFT